MNVITCVKNYITKMVRESTPGMKILVMDKDTTSIISMVFTQSEIQQEEVFLLERIDSGGQGPDINFGLRFLHCLVFVRPTPENIQLLCKELQNPRYGSYYIYFSNIIPKADIKKLAEHDEQEVVKEVQELYMDYLAVNPHLFSVGLPTCLHHLTWQPKALQRTVQAIAAVLLSLRRKPFIRYHRTSKPCEELARKIDELINKESELFDQAKGNAPILLIVDRRDDPFTPLLNQWTYQAMVHELLKIENNRVKLAASKDLSEIVLSAEQDSFYAKNIFLNFGSIAENIKTLMEEFQIKAKSQQKVESIADMKAFVETYPQFKKESGNVTKHVTIIERLSSLVKKHKLLEISELEQELTSQHDYGGAYLQRVRKLLDDADVIHMDAARLVTLYGLRYPGSSDINGLLRRLEKRDVPESLLASVRNVLKYAGNQSSENVLLNPEKAVKITKRFFKGLTGVENIFTQHQPTLQTTLEDLLKGRLREDLFPFVGDRFAGGRPQDVIVFMVGGATYEESLTVHNFNRNFAGTRTLLGGTYIHNSASFMEEVNQATSL